MSIDSLKEILIYVGMIAVLGVFTLFTAFLIYMNDYKEEIWENFYKRYIKDERKRIKK